MRITYDTNRISHFTQRMFYCAWREARNDHIHVLPQVQREILKEWNVENLESELAERIHRIQLGEHPRTNAPQGTEATKYDLMQIWWADELVREDSQIARVPMDEAQRVQKHRFLPLLPPEAFPRVPPEDIPFHSDAHIVAEALATHSAMLMTNNMGSILHTELNQWVRDERKRLGLVSNAIIFNGDSMVMEMLHKEGGERTRGLVRVVLAACWPRDEEASLETLDGYYTAYTDRMENAGLAECGAAARHFWETSDIRKTVEEVRCQLPGRTRKGYARHPHKVSGWEP